MSDDMKTTEPMTEDELTVIEARANAATPGPWTRKPGPRAHFIGALDELDTPTPVITASTYPGEEGVVFCDKDDAAFILAAREDVPRLVAEDRRLRAALASNASFASAIRSAEDATTLYDIATTMVKEANAALG